MTLSLSDLIAKAKEIDRRAQLLSNLLGCVYGLTDTWDRRTISTDRKFFFDMAIGSFFGQIVTHSCALLQLSGRGHDDAILRDYASFVAYEANVHALLRARRTADSSFDQSHDHAVRENVSRLLRIMDSLDEPGFSLFYRYRSKRLAHSTVATGVTDPLVREAIGFATTARDAGDLVSILFLGIGFDHDGAERMAYAAAAASVIPHLDPPPRRRISRNLREEKNGNRPGASPN